MRPAGRVLDTRLRGHERSVGRLMRRPNPRFNAGAYFSQPRSL
jgi:hypothetical protein